MASSAEMVRELRDRTGAGVMDCKAALEASAGDVQGAIEHLRKKGLADAAKKAHRDARDGVVASYIHAGARSACSSRSTARPTLSRAPTTSSSS